MGKVGISEQYLLALKDLSDWVTVSEWAQHVGKIYPDLLVKADAEAKEHKKQSTGLREIAARISSNIVRGAYVGRISIDESSSPRKVKYLTQRIEEEIEDDIREFDRDEIKERDSKSWSEKERYRFDELDRIKKQLSIYIGVSFELDHAKALANKDQPGLHHPDNLQIIIKGHNGKKSDSSWERFTIEEQIEYLQTMVKAYEIIAKKNKMEVEASIINSLMERLKIVY